MTKQDTVTFFLTLASFPFQPVCKWNRLEKFNPPRMCWHSERRSGCVCGHSERSCLFRRSFEEDVNNCKYDDATVVTRMVAEFRKCRSHLTSSHICCAVLTEYRELENMSGVRWHNIRITFHWNPSSGFELRCADGYCLLYAYVLISSCLYYGWTAQVISAISRVMFACESRVWIPMRQLTSWLTLFFPLLL
jgi:hypothetical protein